MAFPLHKRTGHGGFDGQEVLCGDNIMMAVIYTSITASAPRGANAIDSV